MQTKKKNKLDFLKVPPQSKEAEKAVIGGLLLQNDKYDEISHFLSSDDFYLIENKIIFRAIEEILKLSKPCDALTMTDYLKNTGQIDDVGGEFYVFELMNETPSVSNVYAYAKIVYEKSCLRRLIYASTEIAEKAFNPGELALEHVLEHAETQIYRVTQNLGSATSKITQKEALSRAIERIDKLYHSSSEFIGIPTGFKDFDKLTKGLQKKDLIIVAGRPSMGKTTFAINMVENILIHEKKPALIASLEMGEEQLMTRMISSIGKLDHERVFSGKLKDDDWAKFSSSVARLEQTKITFVTDAFMSPTMLRSHARKAIREYGELGVIVIDYLQLMSLRDFKENRTMEITTISRELKLLAKELDVPIVVISQLNRSLEQRQDKRPTMADLRDSGAIEQDADLICFLYRDEVYNPDSEDKGKAELIIAKHRNGKTGRVNLSYLGHYMKFEDMAYQLPSYLA